MVMFLVKRRLVRLRGVKRKIFKPGLIKPDSSTTVDIGSNEMSIWEDDMGDMDLKLIEGESVSNEDSLILIFEVAGSAAPAGPTPVIPNKQVSEFAYRLGE
ncbi:hypothetical protein K435DRAFT_810679 [Dendrothele bispora CBS 962.96]|uniref:Uncharacterized protein n=1 Tax=Dendrothele bispora (strain CBS 962.96) TaxID=1314807 RepID=A0A4S8KUD6_DENBC|nr:hypothetical protein K435DRAFT_810679 [Dendrothele bispora CBS 962.96]